MEPEARGKNKKKEKRKKAEETHAIKSSHSWACSERAGIRGSKAEGPWKQGAPKAP